MGSKDRFFNGLSSQTIQCDVKIIHIINKYLMKLAGKNMMLIVVFNKEKKIFSYDHHQTSFFASNRSKNFL